MARKKRNMENIYSDSSKVIAPPSDDLQTIQLDEVSNLRIGISSVIGKRKQQQDTVIADDDYSYMELGKSIAVLCDGMGGLSGGEKASYTCASMIYTAFHSEDKFKDAPSFFKTMIPLVDEAVVNLKSEDGASLNAGTTLASVVLTESHLFWASVGDSRIYIIRASEILSITKDHNYAMLLSERVKNGAITQEEADSNPKKEALISYIGMGGVKYVDMNSKPFDLQDGDYIVICSDGLYRSLAEREIADTVCAFGTETGIAACRLTELAISKGIKNQDNTSVVVIRYNDSGNCNI